MSTLASLEDEMNRLIREAQAEGLFLRLVGGLAVKVHCDRAPHRSLSRAYPDIDFVTDKAGALRLEAFLRLQGYTSNKTFNTLNGDRRQLYYDEERGRQIDVFIGDFSMCHKLPLAARLHVEPLTVPLAELFLTKAQIVQLNRKDVLDLLALLLDHEVGPSDNESINTAVISDLCAKDWGLYTTLNLTIDKLREFMARGEAELLDEELKQQINDKLTSLQSAMEATPKSLAWKMRAKVGTRMPWYEEVEEVRR